MATTTTFDMLPTSIVADILHRAQLLPHEEAAKKSAWNLTIAKLGHAFNRKHIKETTLWAACIAVEPVVPVRPEVSLQRRQAALLRAAEAAASSLLLRPALPMLLLEGSVPCLPQPTGGHRADWDAKYESIPFTTHLFALACAAGDAATAKALIARDVALHMDMLPRYCYAALHTGNVEAMAALLECYRQPNTSCFASDVPCYLSKARRIAASQPMIALLESALGW